MSASDAMGRQWPKRIPVTDVGFAAPRAARHDPGAMIEPASGTRQPHEVTKVVGALFTSAIKPQLVDPNKISIRATQPTLTRGSLLKHLDSPKSGRQMGGADTSTPVLLKHPDGHHYVLDGHHRMAGAMLRGEPIHARILDASNPQHVELANQYREASHNAASMYRMKLDEAQHLARSRGKSLYGPDDAKIDHEARGLQQEAFRTYHPDSARPSDRRQMGLPPKRRR